MPSERKPKNPKETPAVPKLVIGLPLLTSNPLYNPSPELQASMVKEAIEKIRCEGLTLKDACRQIGIAYGVCRRHIADSQDEGDSERSLYALYTRARMFRAEMYAEEIIEIADDSSGDEIEMDGVFTANTESVQRDKLRIDSRKFILARLVAGFADKATLNVKASLTFGMGDMALEQRKTALLEAANSIALQASEFRRVDKDAYGDVGDIDAPI